MTHVTQMTHYDSQATGIVGHYHLVLMNGEGEEANDKRFLDKIGYFSVFQFCYPSTACFHNSANPSFDTLLYYMHQF